MDDIQLATYLYTHILTYLYIYTQAVFSFSYLKSNQQIF